MRGNFCEQVLFCDITQGGHGTPGWVPKYLNVHAARRVIVNLQTDSLAGIEQRLPPCGTGDVIRN